MEYAIKEIARVIGAKTNQLLDDTVSLLLTDSRRLSFPEKSLFFALKTKTNDGHRYIPVSYTHIRAHETPEHRVCRLLLEKKKIHLVRY